MQPVEQDLKFIESTCQDLDDYILSNQLYWPVDHETYRDGISFSRVTIGLIRLITEQLRAVKLSEEQSSRLKEANRIIDNIQRKWKVAWGKKVSAEFKSRLNLWQEFIRECISDKKVLLSGFRTALSNRTILQLLLLDLPNEEAGLILSLHETDQWLRENLVEGPFIWDDEYQHTFPSEKFWFLYRKPDR
jgi:hypothetical protein